MAERSITFDLLARDRASSTFKKVGKESDSLGGKVRNFGSGFKDAFSPASIASAGALGAAVASFGIASVKAYSEAEAAQRKLSNAFEKFPQLAGANADALRKLNEQLALKTIYDDDVTASAQATLAMFGLTERQLRTLTPLLQDYAAKTGKDLVAAATDLGKAIELGSGRALKNIGIDFVDTGTKAGNFDAVVRGLREQVGGFAAQEGQTLDGRMQILNNRFGELQEQIGEKLLPALISVSDWAVNTGIPALESLMAEIGDIVNAITWVDKKLRQLGDKLTPGKGKGSDGPGLWDILKEVVPGTFDAGGVMPGPKGVHNLAWVAGGETILPTHKQPISDFLPAGGGKVELHMHAVEGVGFAANADYAARTLGWRLGLDGGL